MRIAIFNAAGQCVAILVDSRQKAGSYTMPWMAENLPTGIYICRMETDGSIETEKMMFVK